MEEDIQFGVTKASSSGSEVFELADFETPLTCTPVPAVAWSIEKHKVAQLIATSGMSKQAIARETGVPLPAINKWLQNQEFSDYVNQVVLEAAAVMKAKRLQLMTKILDARIAKAEESDSYDKLSKLDTLDILAAIRKETGEDESDTESKYLHILDKIVSASSKTLDITPSK